MEIHPKPFGESLNLWFRVLGRNWKPLLLTALIVFVPIGLMIGFVIQASGAPESFQLIFEIQVEGEVLSPEEFFDLFRPLVAPFLIWTGLQTLGSVFVGLAATRIVAMDLAGAEASWRDGGSHAMRRTARGIAAGLAVVISMLFLMSIGGAAGWALITALGASFLSVFITTVIVLTVFVLVVWLSFSMSFYLQPMAVEDTGVVESIRRSFRLVRSRWWITLGFVLVTSLIASAAGQVLSAVNIPLVLIFPAVPEALSVSYALTAMIQGVASVAVGAAYAVWYVDLRSREEPIEPGGLI